MAAWIRDATILRWAELTERLSRQELTPGLVTALLLENPLPARAVYDARRIHLESASPACVWTGDRLTANNCDIDHAIPFSLWHNNDLWNLFPMRSALNRAKSDKLPTRRLLLARKEAITQAWEQAYTTYPNRFNAETASFAGKDIAGKTQWPGQLFTLFAEAVEVTAIQRGAERWEPQVK